MKSFVIFASCYFHVAFGSLNERQLRNARCGDVDNCVRAVAGTNRPSLARTLANEDCYSFMTDTVTLASVTTTSTFTTTVSDSVNGPGEMEDWLGGKTVPWYAWPCDVDRYAEVCSCIGFPAATVTKSVKIATEILTSTKTMVITSTPRFANNTRSRVPLFPPANRTATGPWHTSVSRGGTGISSRLSLAPSEAVSTPEHKPSFQWPNSTARTLVSSTRSGFGIYFSTPPTSWNSSSSSSNSATSTITVSSTTHAKSSSGTKNSTEDARTSTFDVTTVTKTVTLTIVPGNTTASLPRASSVCADPTPDFCRGATCVNFLTDANNCGKCGYKCPSGKCQHGVCSTLSCAGSTCGKFSACHGAENCICASTVDGTGFCLDADTACGGLQDCSSNSDCGRGEICAVDTCCDRNVCIRSNTCDNTHKSPKKIFASRVKTKEKTVGGNFVGLLQ